MDFTFHIERDWKIGRIEGEILVFYDVFHWIELVNLMLGAHIKHCLSSVDVRKIYLLLIMILKWRLNFLTYHKITAVILECSERKHSEVSSYEAKLLVIEFHFLPKALCTVGNSPWVLKKWCESVVFAAWKREIEGSFALCLSRAVLAEWAWNVT